MTICLTADELRELTGFAQPRRQLEELCARGFWRARLGRDGNVILERAHYGAVCAGAVAPGKNGSGERPQLRPLSRQS